MELFQKQDGKQNVKEYRARIEKNLGRKMQIANLMSQPISIENYWEKKLFEGHVGLFYLHRAQCQKAARKKCAGLFNKEKGECYEK